MVFKPTSFYELVQALLAVIVTLGVVIAYFAGVELSESVLNAWYLILGLYFGTRNGVKTGQQQAGKE